MMLRKGHIFKWYMGVFLVFLYAPAILLPVFAFNDSSIVSFPLKGFTTKWFAVLQTTEALHVAVRNSLMIAVTTALFSTLFGCASRTCLHPVCLSCPSVHNGIYYVADGLARNNHRGVFVGCDHTDGI